MKKVTLLIALAALVVFAGCKKEKETNGVVLKASIEQNKGNDRTSLNPTDGAINWTAGDKILVNNGTSNATFTLTTGAGSKNGTFTYNGDYTFGASNVAVYPETATISGNTVSLTLPEAQTFTAAGTFGNGANPMLGTFADPEALTFTSLCGVLGVSLTGNNVAITGIEIVSNTTTDKLNGAFEADCTAANPALTPAVGNSGTNSIMLNCDATLTADAQEFYFVLPVGTLANGFTMNVYYGGSEPFSKSTQSTELAVEWNTVKVMSTVEVAASIDSLATPLTLEALSDGNIVVNIVYPGGKGGGVYPGSSKGVPSTISMKYSVNNGERTLINTDNTTTIEVDAGDKVQFYSNGPDMSNFGFPNIAGTAQVKVYGNIMSMLDEDNYATLTTLQDMAFYALFGGNTTLTDASGLLLPATTLAAGCYAGMFYGCESLTAAPELPATTLAAGCYARMFAACTSLTTAPALPATELAGDCYDSMFSGCTSLTTAPALPATTLADGCYYEMFYGCTSLSSITCLATAGINENESTSDWVNGVASTGTFNRASGATWPTGNNGIPSGWTVNEQ